MLKTHAHSKWAGGLLGVALLCLAACGGAGSPPAQEPAAKTLALNEWAVDYEKSALTFTASQAGAEFVGRFASFTAAIDFNPAQPEAGSIAVDIDMTSATTGDRQRDAALPTPDWFDARQFPKAEFRSSSIALLEDGRYRADGALTIRGVSRPVSLVFSLAISGDDARAEGGVAILRGDFGVGQGEFSTDEWVGYGVAIAFVIEASRAPS